MRTYAALLIPTLATLVPQLGVASERHFTYTYESAVLAPGEKEVEIWTTYRHGRVGGFYSALDSRLEYEVGVTDRLQTAFYLNFRTETQEVAGSTPPENETETEFKGVSWEWKYKISDPVADPIGFAVYGELGLGADEAELELKLIADKRIESNLFAANLVYEPEAEFEADETEYEHTIEIDLAAAHFFNNGLAVGLEVRNHNEIVEGEHEHSALFAGPVIFYSTQAFWATLTALPQIAALKGETDDHGLVLDEHERFEVRLLFGLHF
jgi:hypothetical protein